MKIINFWLTKVMQLVRVFRRMVGTSCDDIPMLWRNVLIVIALGKAAIAGAGLGLAVLGALDVASAVTAKEWLTEIQRAYAFDIAAIGGSFVGLIFKIFAR